MAAASFVCVFFNGTVSHITFPLVDFKHPRNLLHFFLRFGFNITRKLLRHKMPIYSELSFDSGRTDNSGPGKPRENINPRPRQSASVLQKGSFHVHRFSCDKQDIVNSCPASIKLSQKVEQAPPKKGIA